MAISQSEIRLLQRKADKYEEFRQRIDRYHAVWSALDGVVEAWEALPGGRNYTNREVAEWLAKHMSPSINVARKALRRKAPNE
jgi:hypothetical protein